MSEALPTLENADWPVLALDATGAIRHANAAAVRAFGAGVQGGAATLAGLWSPENSTPAANFLAASGTFTVRLRMVGGENATLCTALQKFSGGQGELWLLQLFPPPGAAMSETSTAVIQKQRLESALQLARNLALHFNNALTSILGHTSLILGRMETSHPWRSSLIEVEKSAARAAEIAGDLAAFSRQERESRPQAPGNINQLLQRTVEIFQNAGSPQPAWTLQLAPRLYTARFDEAKMQQVFSKIIENAVQSLPEGGGRIAITTRNIDLTVATKDRTAELSAGSYVLTEINDNGRGMDIETLSKVFEPFFTTKRGTHRGLGLTMARAIIVTHGGQITISSGLSTGTSVRVYLPADKKIIQDTVLDNDGLKGTQTILIVDDEELLLTSGKAILSAFGYKVLTAGNAEKALDLLNKNGSSIDLLFTDLVMPPGMSGRELAEKANALHPGLHVLFTSGYDMHGGSEDSTYLQKPFTSRQLLLKVKNVLAESEE